MSFNFIEPNGSYQERLEEFIRSLSTEDYACANALRWTVTALIGPLAL